jgi:hypothetical protein
MIENKCENCALRLELKIHGAVENKKEIEKLLKDKGITHICLAFAHEGVGIIGEFKGVGCEAFSPKSEK